jgi:hypothetical protein
LLVQRIRPIIGVGFRSVVIDLAQVVVLDRRIEAPLIGELTRVHSLALIVGLQADADGTAFLDPDFDGQPDHMILSAIDEYEYLWRGRRGTANPKPWQHPGKQEEDQR